MNNEWYALADTILTLILFSGSQFKNWSFTNTCDKGRDRCFF
ncbi:hypothetical protein MtrunA17_Chr5g0411481 [Medicago truncatula]|uniref:Uncharacterized protein n=1 Tax=Medicago truncatula TaxID=3880 RepID=A0A396HQT9_MEDTR|nr:hypothetical protein MtrunA17_Chr5g0411481 [Medicago truncatula]